MGQKLYLIKKDKYRLNLSAFDFELKDEILRGDSKFNFRFSIKEKFSEPALESYKATLVLKDKIAKVGFDLYTKLDFGTYLYVIELINVAGKVVDELAYGFIEIRPDI